MYALIASNMYVALTLFYTYVATYIYSYVLYAYIYLLIHSSYIATCYVYLNAYTF